MTAGAVRRAPISSPNWLSSLAERRIGLELEELIAQHRRQLEIQLLGRRLHLLLEQPDEGVALPRVGRTADGAGCRFRGPSVSHARDEPNVEHRFDDRPRYDPMLLVIRELRLPAAIHLVERALHRAR